MKITAVKTYRFTFDAEDAKMAYAMYRELFKTIRMELLLVLAMREDAKVRQLTILNKITRNTGLQIELDDYEVQQLLSDLHDYGVSTQDAVNGARAMELYRAIKDEHVEGWY